MIRAEGRLDVVVGLLESVDIAVRSMVEEREISPEFDGDSASLGPIVDDSCNRSDEEDICSTVPVIWAA